MLRNVFLKSLRDRRRSLFWWILGLGALILVTLAFYPAVHTTTEITAIYDELPKALTQLFLGPFTDLTSPSGYLNTQLFVLMIPLLFIVFAIVLGSSGIAGEEDRGTLELLLSLPLTRYRVVLDKFAAMGLNVVALTLGSWVWLVIGTKLVGLEIGVSNLAQVCISAAMISMVFGTLALGLGCASGKRTLSVGVTSAIGVSTYLIYTLAPLKEELINAQKLSPFYYYIGGDPLSNGIDLSHFGILMGVVGMLLIGALATFARRDLRN